MPSRSGSSGSFARSSSLRRSAPGGGLCSRTSGSSSLPSPLHPLAHRARARRTGPGRKIGAYPRACHPRGGHHPGRPGDTCGPLRLNPGRSGLVGRAGSRLLVLASLACSWFSVVEPGRYRCGRGSPFWACQEKHSSIHPIAWKMHSANFASTAFSVDGLEDIPNITHLRDALRVTRE